EFPDGTCAILVRSRTHLEETIKLLNANGIRYQAQDVDPLVDRTVVSDLLALTRALLQPCDRVAWLAVLRAPWCGLTLSDLLQLAPHDKNVTVLEHLDNL
ncbi:MAG: hypothetical protein GWN87_16510, partial [Desulfuromonadales bacterium]|nr:hypothetical protein [Desulfuromonadales bacterium]NIS41817.1 hypothetical protein [Desulfuromonadales bacterium]